MNTIFVNSDRYCEKSTPDSESSISTSKYFLIQFSSMTEIKMKSSYQTITTVNI